MHLDRWEERDGIRHIYAFNNINNYSNNAREKYETEFYTDSSKVHTELTLFTYKGQLFCSHLFTHAPAPNPKISIEI